MVSIDVGLLLLRVVVGLLLIGHGAQKLFGWFGGYGLAGTTGWLASLGLKPAKLWAFMGGLSEFGGGLLVMLGLLNPIGPLAIIGAMAMAIGLAHWSNGLWATNGGYEYPLVLLVLAIAIGLVGPGSYSLDAVLGLALPSSLLLAAGLAGVALVVGYGLALTARQKGSSEQQAA